MTMTHKPATLNGSVSLLPAIWVAKSRGRSEVVRAPCKISALYARYSAERQTQTSIERQCELCEEHASRIGVDINWRFIDRARPGTTVVGRAGLEDMLEAARNHEFGVLITENVDRLSRDLSDLAKVFKELTELGIEIHQPGRGKLGLPDIAFHGFMGQEGRRLFLERTQRGRVLKARMGRFPSKLSYGYSLVPGCPGQRVINEAQAPTVRDIYRMRWEGLTTRQIAVCLNKRPDRDKDWSNGGVESILRNALYAGLIVYNQTTRVKGDGGLMVEVTNPHEDWVVTPVEELRIVDQTLWEAVQSLTQAKEADPHKVPVRRRKYLLSAKLRCPECDRVMTVGGSANHRRFQCYHGTETGLCGNRSTFRLDQVEKLVIGLVAEHLLDPRCTEAYATAYDETRRKSSVDYETKRSGLVRDIEDLAAELKATFKSSVMAGFADEYIVETRQSLWARMEELRQALALMPNKPPRMGLEPERIATLRDAVRSMMTTLPFEPESEADLRLAAAFADLIERIVPRRTSAGSFDAEVHLTVVPLMNGASDAVRQASGDLHLHATFQRESRVENHAWAEAHRAVLAEGRYRLRDHEWNAISHLLPDEIMRLKDQPGSHDVRGYVEAHLCLLMARAPWSSLPERFGRWDTVYMSVSKLITLGVWREVCEILTSLDPDRFERTFADVTCRKVKLGRNVVELVEKRRAAEAEARKRPDSG